MASSFSTRRPAVDPEEVFKVADDMVTAGRQVTALAILDALGGGSLRTIYKHLNEWEKRRKEAPAVSSTADVPEAVQSRFAAALADSWRLMASEAAREVTTAKEKASAEVASLQVKFDDALEGMQRYEEQLEVANSSIEEMRLQIANLEQQNKDLSHENTGLKATASQLSNQIKDQQAQMDQLHQAHEKDRQAHKDQLDKVMHEHSTVQNKSAEQIEKLQKEKESLQKKLDQGELERQAIAMKVEQAEKRSASADKARDQANSEREKSAQAAAELRGQVEAQKAQIDRLLADSKPNS